jgi:hypothetical protein
MTEQTEFEHYKTERRYVAEVQFEGVESEHIDAGVVQRGTVKSKRQGQKGRKKINRFDKGRKRGECR